MQGMRFLIVGQDGRPVNHGVIAQKVSEDKFLCQFARQPTSCRLVHTDEILNWNLFPTDDDLNTFIANLVEQNPPAPDQVPGELEVGPATNDPQKKTPRKKAAKKKAAKKKPNGKTKR